MKGAIPPPHRKGNDMSTDTTTEATTETFVSPKDLAEAWGTDPKSVRRFLRGLTTNRAGKGGRWEISTEDVEALTKAWNAKGETKRFVAAGLPEADAEAAAHEVDETMIDEEIVELEDADELDDIDEL